MNKEEVQKILERRAKQLLEEISNIYKEYTNFCRNIGLAIAPRTHLFPDLSEGKKIAFIRIAKDLVSATGQRYTFFAIASDFPLRWDLDVVDRWRSRGNTVFGIHLFPHPYDDIRFFTDTYWQFSPERTARGIGETLCFPLISELESFRDMLRERVDDFIQRKEAEIESHLEQRKEEIKKMLAEILYGKLG